MFQELIDAIKAKKVAEIEYKQRQEKMLEDLKPLKTQLESIVNIETHLREEVLRTLQENKEDNVMVGDSSITVAMKVTPKIVDTDATLDFLNENKEEIEKEFGIGFNDLPLETKTEKTFTNKKDLLAFINKYKQLTDKEIPGVEETQTDFLTIKL